MRLTVDHVTTYRYDQPVRGVVQSHRLTPSVHRRPEGAGLGGHGQDGVPGGSYRDGAGDLVQGWTVAGPVSEVTVTVRGTVETDGYLRRPARLPRNACRRAPICATPPSTGAGCGLARSGRRRSRAADPLALAHALSAAVADAIAYRPGVTHAHTTAAEALALGEGVCQDHAHALIACARVAWDAGALCLGLSVRDRGWLGA